MDDKLKNILAKVSTTCDFEGVNFSDVNASGIDGDNALHVVVRWNDLDAAATLIKAGIDVNKQGDLGYTPLHVACMEGNLEMVEFLVSNGADIFALSEGVPPFTTAREAGQDRICDFLAPLMNEAQVRDPKVRFKSRIVQLQRELALLESKLR